MVQPSDTGADMSFFIVTNLKSGKHHCGDVCSQVHEARIQRELFGEA